MRAGVEIENLLRKRASYHRCEGWQW